MGRKLAMEAVPLKSRPTPTTAMARRRRMEHIGTRIHLSGVKSQSGIIKTPSKVNKPDRISGVSPTTTRMRGLSTIGKIRLTVGSLTRTTTIRNRKRTSKISIIRGMSRSRLTRLGRTISRGLRSSSRNMGRESQLRKIF